MRRGAPAESLIPCQNRPNVIVLAPLLRHQLDDPGPLTMPSLIRLLTVVAILCAVVYGGLYSLAHFVQPTPREMSVYIPPSKFFQQP